MNRKIIISFIVLIISILFTGCKKKEEYIKIPGKDIGSGIVDCIIIDKKWTFDYYTIDESDEDYIITIHYKPYEEDE